MFRTIKRFSRVLCSSIIALSFLASASAALIEPSANLEQSPIAVRPENTQYAALPPLLFDYTGFTSLSVINTGSPDHEATIRADVSTGAGSVSVAGDVFNLLQFHFHIPGEHELLGNTGAMELHLVHQALDGTLLVIGQQIWEGSENQLLQPIFSNLPLNAGDTALIDSFALSGLIPSDLRSFRYPGSLTTAPYTEGVRWNLLAAPLYLSRSQIDAYSALFPHGDSRELQPLNGRVVLTDVTDFEPVPEPSTLLLAGIGALVLIGYRTGRNGSTQEPRPTL